MYDDLVIDDLSEKHQEIANAVGIEGMLSLSREFGGTQVYIPKIDELLKYRTHKAIIKGLSKGMGVKELAIKYNVSESTVYRLIRDKLGSEKVLSGQMSIYDFTDK